MISKARCGLLGLLATMTGEPHNKPLNLPVTPVACAMAAPAG